MANAISRERSSFIPRSLSKLVTLLLLGAGALWSQDQAFTHAFALYRSGQVSRARDVLQRAVQNAPAALDLSLLGSIEYQQNQLREAGAHLERALALDPGLPATRLTLAQVRNLQGNSEGALAILLDAKKRRPDDPAVLYALGVICLQMDLIADANANLARAAALEPHNSSARYALASARIADRDVPAAIHIYQELLKSEPGSARLNYALGAAYFLSNQSSVAKLYLEKSIQLLPEQVESYYYLGLIAHEQGDDNKSIELLDTVLARRPDHARALVALGMEYRFAGRLDDAKVELEKAVAADPKSQKAHYQLGLLLTAIHRPEEAKAELATAGRLRASTDDKVSWQLVSP